MKDLLQNTNSQWTGVLCNVIIPIVYVKGYIK